jgi:N,N'-diacetylchitobiose phosphorylase
MQYGHFDDRNKEYVITRPDTPKPWSNYLGDTGYGAIITNNAGGYSFFKSGGMGRFMRMRFNSVPLDQPGRYIYFHDRDSKQFWSNAWQPVGKPLDSFESTCRHGTAYTVITSKYDRIESETTYFVPLNRSLELWKVRVTNHGNGTRRLRAFSYLEYAGNWNAVDDLLNIQYVQYTAKMEVVDGIIDHGTNVNIPEMPHDFREKDQGRHTFHAMTGLDLVGFDTDREAFLGPYRTYANPRVVEQGAPSNSLGYGDNPCGSLCGELTLKPGESREFLVLTGIGKAGKEGKEAVAEFSGMARVDAEFEALRQSWHTRMAGLTAETPDPELNSTINAWGIYNALITFNWSRSVSLIYSGIDRDGLGYRDTVQDIVGIVHAIPEQARERLELMISGQLSTGGAMPVVTPVSHTPGAETAPDPSEYRSDDCLWLFNAVPAYVKETGHVDFYRKKIPFADRGSGTVLMHLRRAIEFSIERSGRHGLPYGLKADWNDCLRFGESGESVFVAMQLRLALREYVEISGMLGETEEERWGRQQLEKLDASLQEHAWDGKWFMRGYRADGMKFGSSDSPEGKIFLNPQSWSVISGAATPEQAGSAMEQVDALLATDFGLKLCTPPYTASDYNIVRAMLMNPGLKENGGIFIHTQAWGVMAEAMLGHGDRAYRYLRAYLPAACNSRAEVREIEPYVVCQSTHTEYSHKQGASRIPWLSGSAAWTYHAVSQFILGIRPEYHGITIDPCIPAEWRHFSAVRIFRGKTLEIRVSNPDGLQRGVRTIRVNGREQQDPYIPADLLTSTTLIELVMG